MIPVKFRIGAIDEQAPTKMNRQKGKESGGTATEVEQSPEWTTRQKGKSDDQGHVGTSGRRVVNSDRRRLRPQASYWSIRG